MTDPRISLADLDQRDATLRRAPEPDPIAYLKERAQAALDMLLAGKPTQARRILAELVAEL